MPKGGLFSRAIARQRYRAKNKCPKCGSKDIKKGSDFILCQNPHCLALTKLKGGLNQNDKLKGRSTKIRSTKN